MRKLKELLTTGIVGEICCVAPITVKKWVRSSHIRGCILPPGKDLRIARDDLIEFLKKHNFPDIILEKFGLKPKSILVATIGSIEGNSLFKNMPENTIVVNSFVEVGIKIQEYYPTKVVIDMNLGKFEAFKTGAVLRKHLGSQAKLIAIRAEDDEDEETPKNYGFNDSTNVRSWEVLSKFFE